MNPAGRTDLLVAGFEPFGGRSSNRSLDVLRRLEGRAGIDTTMLPVDFSRLDEAVARLVDLKPQALLLIGESPRAGVAVEQVALNIVDTDRPDNAGRTPQSQAIHAGEALALRLGWDAHAVVRELKVAGVPAEVSFHAGTYACNAALYLALRRFPPGTPIGFMHVNKWRWPRGVRLAQLVLAAELCAAALQSPAHNAGSTKS